MSTLQQHLFRAIERIDSVVSIGDLNQDGYGDVAVWLGSWNSSQSWRVAVVYGQPIAGSREINLSLPSPLDVFGRPHYEIYDVNDPSIPFSGQGRSFQLIGDVNGDGRRDVAVFQSRPIDDGRQKNNYVLFSPPGGLRVANFWNRQDLDGRNGFYLPGRVVDFAGDVNGDGLADVAVNTNAGSVVVFGRREGWPETIAPETLDGSNGFRIPGRTLAAGGADLNGDGRSELFLRGGALLFSRDRYPAAIEGTGWLTEIQEPETSVALVLKSLGDLNQDGLDDLIVVRKERRERFGFQSLIFYGSRDSWPSTLIFNQANESLSGEITDCADFNNDGWLDLLTNKSRNCSGCPIPVETALTFGEAEGWPRAGRTLSFGELSYNAKDFNGDGIDDLLVFTRPIGSATTQRLLFGGRLGFLPGERPNLTEGLSLSTNWPWQPVGDVNGDGFADLVGGSIVLLGQGDRPPVTVNGGVYHHFQFPMANATPHDRLTFQSQPGQPDWVYGGRGNDTLIGASGAMDQFTGGPGADRFVLNREYGFQSGQGFVVVWDFEKGKDKVVVQGRPEDYFFVPDASPWLDNRNAPFLQHRGSDTSAVPNTLLARRHPELGAVMIATFSDVQLDPLDLIYL